ncbi:MAG: phage/plasmid primase, P4 family [Chloroflexota bacterium]|nr:phage/plasmid primase, P4 family [Chloroflexota bacterium]
MAAIEREGTPPATLPVDPDGIPDELKIHTQFVCWDWEFRRDRWTKPPLRAAGNGYAKSNDPTTWAPFDATFAAYQQRDLAGVGFALSAEDDFFFIDFDHCRDPETGEISQWAREILRSFPHTYRALSPTGTGIRVIGRGQLPGPQHTKPMVGRPGAKPDAKIELYDKLKYTTLTGHRYDGSPLHLGDCQAALNALYDNIWPSTADDAPPLRQSRPHDEDDDRRLDRARASRQGADFVALFDQGDTSPYSGDDSSADLALCNMLAFWFGPDPVRIDRLFRRSALMREKWDKRHHGDGRTYGQGTIDAALAGRTEFYQPRQPRLRVVNGAQTRPDGGGRSGTAPQAGSEESSEAPHLTDMGNAERLRRRHGHDLRYCKPWNSWLIWDGQRWAKDDAGHIVRLAKETVRAIYAEAADASDDEARKTIAKHALRSEGEARVRAAISLAESEPGIPTTPDQLDQHRWLLNVRNGTLDLRSGELRAHDRGDLLTQLAPLAYDPDASCPTFLAFLERIMAGNEGLIRFLQRAIGYSLTGDTSERVLMILHGEGRNGKSTLLEVVRGILGGYAVRTPTETLLAKRDSTIPNDIAKLKGARFVSASESDEGRRLDEAKIKDLTGGDTISARFMRGEWFDFLPEFKLWLGTNHKPVIRGTDRAIWDRIRLVPFAVRIPDEEQDKQLRVKLLTEAPGILAWAVRGCLDWQRDGLGEPQEVKTATAGYRAEMDVLGAFLEDCCIIASNAQCPAKDLYAAYQTWCEETGEKALTQKAVGQRLGERGFESGRLAGGQRTRVWKGIGLIGSAQQQEFSNDQAGHVSRGGTRWDAKSDITEPVFKPREDMPENASQRVPEENASPLEGYAESAPLWEDLPPTDEGQEDDDPWTR